MAPPQKQNDDQTRPIESLTDPNHPFPGEDEATGSEGAGRTIGLGADEQARNAYEDARRELPKPRPRQPR